MRRFGLVMDDDLYIEFYRLFPDFGQRTNLLRKCVQRMVKKARVVGYVAPVDVDEIANNAVKEETGNEPS